MSGRGPGGHKRPRTASSRRGGGGVRRALKYTSGRKARNAIVSVPRNRMGYPQSMRTQMRYCESFDISPSSSSPIMKTFRANGMYDPDTATGGHQPRGFDEFTSTYLKYTVKGAKMSVVFTYEAYNGCVGTTATGNPTQVIGTQAPAPAGVPAAICLVRPSVQATPPTENIFRQQEINKSKWVTINPQSGPGIVATSTAVSDWFGKDFLVGSDGYTGTSSTDPGNEVFFHIMTGLQHDNYSIGSVQIRANVTITYDVVWTEPKPLPAS